jgi:lipopolysaccharide export LptBFGC system permease protein LptF
MLKIKVFIIAGVLSLAAIVLNSSSVPISEAQADPVLKEISGYKNWTKITKEPIFTLAASSGGG